MKDNAEYQENIKAVIEILQLFHDSLDVAGKPKALCSYCGKAFETIALVKLHVPACKQNPLIAEIERLQPLAASQPALLAACEACVSIIGIKDIGLAKKLAKAAIKAAKGQ